MVEKFLRRALGESGGQIPHVRSDFKLSPQPDDAQPSGLAEAAVLIPVLLHNSEPSLVLTKRSEQLNKHAGQISFPGGRIEEMDESPLEAALRETHEEIGLERDKVTVVGQLDRYITGTGFSITPVVGVIRGRYIWQPDADEVEDVFEVSLSFLRDRKNHQQREALWQGRKRTYYAIPYENRLIWGATAAMIVNLCDVLDQAEGNL